MKEAPAIQPVLMLWRLGRRRGGEPTLTQFSPEYPGRRPAEDPAFCADILGPGRQVPRCRDGCQDGMDRIGTGPPGAGLGLPEGGVLHGRIAAPETGIDARDVPEYQERWDLQLPWRSIRRIGPCCRAVLTHSRHSVASRNPLLAFWGIWRVRWHVPVSLEVFHNPLFARARSRTGSSLRRKRPESPSKPRGSCEPPLLGVPFGQVPTSCGNVHGCFRCLGALHRRP